MLTIIPTTALKSGFHLILSVQLQIRDNKIDAARTLETSCCLLLDATEIMHNKY